MITDPIALKAIEMGKQLVTECGGDWRVYARDAFNKLKIVENIMFKIAREKPEEYAQMTFEERAKVAEKAINIISNRYDTARCANQLGLN